jgi:hypothetical protein
MDNIITEQQLKDLGFLKEEETMETFGGDTDWYYYTLEIGTLCLLTQSSDEVVDGWIVEIFDDESIRVTESNELILLVDLLKRNKIK